MKKLMTIALGLGLVLGGASFAQTKSTAKAKSTKPAKAKSTKPAKAKSTAKM